MCHIVMKKMFYVSADIPYEDSHWFTRKVYNLSFKVSVSHCTSCEAKQGLVVNQKNINSRNVQNTIHCAKHYSLCKTLYTVQNTIHCAKHYTLCKTLYTVQNTIHCAKHYTLCKTLYTVQNTIHCAKHYSLCKTLFTAQNTIHCAKHYSLCKTLFTVQNTIHCAKHYTLCKPFLIITINCFEDDVICEILMSCCQIIK